MTNKYISLRVNGRPDANGGFSPIVSFNSPSFELKDMAYGGFDENSYFFSVVIEPTQVVYKLIKNKVRSFSAIREGNLIIAMSIPCGYKINGYTPYEALMELKDEFFKSCMICKDEATQVYEFNSKIINPNVLDEAAKKIVIQQVGGPYHPMTPGQPIGCILVDEENIVKLLNDVQYPIFKNYSEVFIAEKGQGTNCTPITNIAIPRIKEYGIYVDGIRKDIVTDEAKVLTYRGNGNPSYYENNSVSFSIQELKEGNQVEGVTFDAVNERVNVNTDAYKIPLKKVVQLFFETSEIETHFKPSWRDIVLTYNGQHIMLNDNFTFTLVGDQIAALSPINQRNFVVKLPYSDKYKLKNLRIINGNMIIETEVMPSRMVDTTIGQPKNSSMREILLSFKGNFLSELNLLYVDIVRKDANNGKIKLYQSTKVSFKGNKGVYTANVYIPEEWCRNNDMYVRLKDDTRCFDSKKPLDFKSKDGIELHEDNFVEVPKNFYEKVVKPFVWLYVSILVLLLGFVAGMFIGYLNYEGIHALLNKEETVVESVVNGTANAVENAATVEEAEEIVNEKIFSCDKCPEIFGSEEELEAHKADKHTIKCSICGQQFGSQEELGEHLKSHTLHPRTLVYKCPICGKEFDSEAKLNGHKNENHHFVCEECGPSVYFNTREELNAHKQSKHNNRREER